MNTVHLFRALSLTLVAGSALRAQATLIDFENLTGGTNAINNVGQLVGLNFAAPLTNNGYTFTGGSQFATWLPSSTITSYANYTGSNALFSNNANVSTPTTVTQVGGGAFSLLSLDIANVLRQSTSSNTITFTGTLAQGGTVSQTYLIPSDDALHTLTFSNFNGLSSLQMASAGGNLNYFQYDNLNLQAVPEPASMVALAVGVVTFLRRRR